MNILIERMSTKNIQSFVTLDQKHVEIMEQFKSEEANEIPLLLNEKNKIMKELNQSNMKTDNLFQLKEINSKINEIKKKKKMYLLNNSKLIFNFFEEKKKISENITKENSSNDKINNFFFKKNIQEPIKNTTESISHKYLSKYDDKYIDLNLYSYNISVCNKCFQGEMIHSEEDGMLICNSCYQFIPYFIESEKPSYKDPPKEISFYAYQRKNHFKEKLSQLQGKKSTQIPIDVIQNVKRQIQKERLELSEITGSIIKKILKNLKYNKYYEHINNIMNILGIPPPVVSPELEEKMCNLFMEIQHPFSIFCPDDRDNFFNYYYIMYKLFERLNEYQYLKYIPLLKDDDIIIKQDILYKKICQFKKWKFNHTLKI
jgi:hypothetical protein